MSFSDFLGGIVSVSLLAMLCVCPDPPQTVPEHLKPEG
jgi:hypothetical protein